MAGGDGAASGEGARKDKAVLVVVVIVASSRHQHYWGTTSTRQADVQGASRRLFSGARGKKVSDKEEKYTAGV